MATRGTAIDFGIDSGGAGLELVGALLGAAATLGLFLGISRFEAKEPDEDPVNIVEMRALSVPMDTPPPRPADNPPVVGFESPFAGLEVGPTESEVKIAVLPPAIEQLVPAPRAAPAAAIEVSQLYSEFKPRMDLSADFSRVFQQSEVDQKPLVLSRPTPYIPHMVRRGAVQLRVVMLLMVDEKGMVGSVRVLESSGNAEFDAIIVRDTREAWVFSPAVRKGRKVKCLLQQSVRVNWNGTASPFDS